LPREEHEGDGACRAGDTAGHATIRWPEGRSHQAFGEISLREIAIETASKQQ
jgi:hypothetical protein